MNINEAIPYPNLNCDVTRLAVVQPYQLVVRAKRACSLRFFLVKMSGLDRLQSV